MLTDDRKAELRALCDAATPGPWEWVDGYLVGAGGKRLYGPHNYALIAASRTALPEMLDEVDRLQSLAADGEKYRRLKDVIRDEPVELLWLPAHKVYRASAMDAWGHFYYAVSSADPLAALEADGKKSEEVTNDA